MIPDPINAARPGEQAAAVPAGWRQRLAGLVLEQLRQGITPQKIALTLSLGFTVGIFPILGTTTALCALIGIRLRLNQPLIQLVNYLVYPLQILLLIPFYRAGETLFRQPPVPLFSITELAQRFQAGPWQFLLDYGLVGVYGVVVWGLCAPLLGLGLYGLLRPLLLRLASRQA